MVKFKALQTICMLLLIGIIIFYLVSIFSIESLAVHKSNSTEATRENFDKSSLFWMVGILGGCIAITLSYVSFKKYKAEEKEKVKKLKKDSNS